jgi:large subunit ribosomal protein L10
MPNLVNESITAEYEGTLKGDLDALFVQPVGLSVEDVNVFRGKLDEANLQMRLLKGSLARRILEAEGLTDVAPLFDGPAAVISSGHFGTPQAEAAEVDCVAITASRVIAAWRRETKNALPEVKGGIMEGEVLDGTRATALAKLPTKEALQATVSGQITSPGSTLSAQLIAAGGRIAGAIKSHIEKLEEAG